MTARSKSMRDLCRYAPCFLDLPHQCVMYQGCEPMHSDSSLFGRGFSFKSIDLCAAGCRNAHALMTAHVGDDLDRETKFFAWLRAFAKTFDFFVAHGWITPNMTKARREGTVPI